MSFGLIKFPYRPKLFRCYTKALNDEFPQQQNESDRSLVPNCPRCGSNDSTQFMGIVECEPDSEHPSLPFLPEYYCSKCDNQFAVQYS